jgi:hypothetical protein
MKQSNQSSLSFDYVNVKAGSCRCGGILRRKITVSSTDYSCEKCGNGYHIPNKKSNGFPWLNPSFVPVKIIPKIIEDRDFDLKYDCEEVEA